MGCNSQTAPVDNISCVLPGQENKDAGDRICQVPERNPAANMEINVELTDFTDAQAVKMHSALERLKIVLNSKVFKEKILNHKYNGEFTFINNMGLSNQEIYEKIMLGAESLKPEVDEELDLDITLYYKKNSTVGYTYPNVNRIWVNNNFFATFTLGKVAANAVHEWTHKIGFDHDSNRTSRRAFSVPYGVGTIVQKLVDGM
jgi:hypothetical protein